jgi:hypothetical protein
MKGIQEIDWVQLHLQSGFLTGNNYIMPVKNQWRRHQDWNVKRLRYFFFLLIIPLLKIYIVYSSDFIDLKL